MTISLNETRQRLAVRLAIVNGGFDRLLVARSSGFRIDRFALQEGLVSQLWQAWGLFCRQTIIASARGGITSTGQLTSSPFAGLSEGQIAFAANQLANGQKINGRKSLPSHREPTWGDIGKLVLITNGLGLTNSNNLLSAFGSPTTVKDLQTCRNSSAHLNSDNISNIRLAAVRYSATKFVHPSDMMFWTDPKTTDFLWQSWILEIEAVSSLAVI